MTKTEQFIRKLRPGDTVRCADPYRKPYLAKVVVMKSPNVRDMWYLEGIDYCARTLIGFGNDNSIEDVRIPYLRLLERYNKLLKKGFWETMANKLLAALKLNAEERKLQKAGVLDENGNLTTDGQELVLNLIAKEKRTELVDMTKDLIKDKKKSKDED